jgi:hypothetical protein
LHAKNIPEFLCVLQLFIILQRQKFATRLQRNCNTFAAQLIKINNKNMKKIIFWMTALVIAITMAMEAKAQTNQAVQTVRGQVCDVASGEPMIGVTITERG